MKIDILFSALMETAKRFGRMGWKGEVDLPLPIYSGLVYQMSEMYKREYR